MSRSDEAWTGVPVGLSSFSHIRKVGLRYVDKTGYISTLLERGKKFFLSRPRKFGKSLFVSMLESFFRTETSLFENLQILKNPPEFSPQQFPGKLWGDNLAPFPVIRLDLSGIEPELLVTSLIKQIVSIGKFYGVEITEADVPSALESLVCSLAGINGNDHGQVVVLVDEYDSPIMSNMDWGGMSQPGKITAAQTSIHVLALFFARLKKLEDFIRFVFVTGVSKVAHTMLFSGGNDLQVRTSMLYVQQHISFLLCLNQAHPR
jgi:hypothetical protein